MGALLEKLDQQLTKYLQEKETRLTWSEWTAWLKVTGCELNPTKPNNLSDSRKLSY